MLVASWLLPCHASFQTSCKLESQIIQWLGQWIRDFIQPSVSGLGIIALRPSLLPSTSGWINPYLPPNHDIITRVIVEHAEFFYK